MPDEPQNQPSPPDADAPTSAPVGNNAANLSPATPAIESEPSTQGSSSEAVTSDMPAPSNELAQPAPVTPLVATGKSSGGKKKWVLGSVIAAVLVVLLGGGALAYNLWYQNPEKVILDGINNLFSNNASSSGKATVSVENDDVRLDMTASVKSDKKLTNGDVQLAVQMKGSDAPVKKVNLKADFAVNEKTAYFKLNDIKPLADQLVDAYVDQMATQYRQLGFALTQQQIDQQKAQMLQQLNPIITKIDNRWIKFDMEASEEDDESKCTAEAFQKLYDDKKQRDEVLDVYKEHKFITVKEKLGSKDGSLGYLLEFDEGVAKDFSKAVKNTTFSKELEECDGTKNQAPSTEDTTDKKDNVKDSRIELWVSRWSHQITEFKVAATTNDSSETAVSFNLTYDYDKVEGLTTPKDAIDIDELRNEFDKQSQPSAAPVTVSPLSI